MAAPLIGVDLTKVRTASEGAEFRVGTLALVTDPSTGDKLYRYVQYNAGAGSIASVAGRVGSVYAAGGAGGAATSKNVLTMDGSDSLAIGGGVFQAVVPHLGFGWVQIRGTATLSAALVAGADGNALTRVGATADTGDLDVAALVTDNICAVALDASASIVHLNME